MHFYIGEGAPSSSNPSAGAPPAAGAPTAPGAPSTAPSATGTTTTPAAPSAAPARVPPASSAVSSAPAGVRPKPPRAAAAKKVTQYWIQAGAYKSQDKAEELVKLLDGKGISSRVFSYASRSDTWYRVRVGPYINRGEAGKFLSLVKQVQGLEESYISLVPVSRSALN